MLDIRTTDIRTQNSFEMEGLYLNTTWECCPIYYKSTHISIRIALLDEFNIKKTAL
jgi:hypothetical protein